MQEFCISFFCYYPNGNKTEHRQMLRLDQVGRWIECYQFTHPHCEAISCKVWLHNEVQNNE